MQQKPRKHFISSVAFRVQLSLIVLSLIGIGFSVYTYNHLKGYVEQDTYEMLRFDIILQIIVALFFNVILGLLIYNAITDPVKKLCSIIDEIAHGNFKVDVPYTNLGSEIGDFAEKVKLFKEKSERLLEIEKVYSDIRIRESEERRKKLNETIGHEFDNKIISITNNFKGLSSKLLVNSMNLVSAAKKNGEHVNVLIQISEQADSNVNNVAAAAAKLTSSITEISSQTAKSASITENAAARINNINNQTNELTEGAEKISEVTELINNIAERINLLALNATIEAARAGDAGNGFAVVASEVKNLAEQTTNATEQISTLIQNIQGKTKNTVSTIRDINQSIFEINNISRKIADAVEEQSTATREISRNIHQAAISTRTVKKSVEEAANNNANVENFSGTIHGSSNEISLSTNKLDSEITSFVGMIKNNLDS